MKFRLGVAAVLMSTVPAFGQTGLDPVIQELERQGFGAFEVYNQGGIIEIEARRGLSKRELKYDATTGALVSDETKAAEGEVVAIDPATVPAGLGPVVSSLIEQGFTVTEIENAMGKIEIEARMGSIVREIAYDASTGAMLSDEMEDERDEDEEEAEEEAEEAEEEEEKAKEEAEEESGRGSRGDDESDDESDDGDDNEADENDSDSGDSDSDSGDSDSGDGGDSDSDSGDGGSSDSDSGDSDSGDDGGDDD